MEREVATRTTLTSFVGRRHELGKLRALLAEARLVTVTGPGGVGKTRLTEEFAQSVARSFEGAVAFAYLAPARTPFEVAETVAGSVDLRNRGEHAIEDELAEYLGVQRLLLILDNCEHVVDAAGDLVATLLRRCPGVLVVATGRQPLHVPGEQLYPIGGLQPESAVELFAARAGLAMPSFALNEATEPLVEQICQRLEGMPLAIELAAAQVRSFGLVELRRQLEGHLADLAVRGSVAPERQRTLRQAIAWSHELLGDAQQTVWRRLSVFSGGFTLQAAEQVADGSPITASDVPRLLGDLVDQSMVVFDPDADRYRLLEALREFARERLREANEEGVFTERHRRWMLTITHECDRRWFGPDEPRLVDRLHVEASNLRAALENCRETDAAADGLRLASGAFWLWLTRASLQEGERWCWTFLGGSNDPALDARTRWRAAYLATLRLDFAAAHELLTAFDGNATGEHALDRAYARVVRGLLIAYEHRERAEESRRLCDETFADPAADEMARAWSRMISALASFALGDFEACREAADVGVAICRGAGDLWGLEIALRYLAQAEWQLGRPDAAESALIECLEIDRRLDDLWHMAWATELLSWLAVDAGKLERGARLLGIAAEFWARTGSRLPVPWQARHEAAVERLRERLGEARLRAEIDVGRAFRQPEALAFALEETEATEPRAAAAPVLLSDRELEIAGLVATGLGNREIARKLFLSPRTVETHVKHVMDKLGLDSRAEIAAWYARRRPSPLS